MSMSTDAKFSPVAFPVLKNADQERLEAQSQARGYSAGYAAGLRAAAEEARQQQERLEAEHTAALRHGRARVDRAVAALEAAAEALDRRTLPVLADAEQTLAAAAVELAEAILGYELGNGANSAQAALARALSRTEATGVHTVRLNPADLSVLDEETRSRSGVQLVPDPALAPGDAIGEFPDGYLDARLGTALARAKESLLGGTP